jgi:hypothetical protein
MTIATRTFELKTLGDITATYHEQERPVIIGSITVNKKSIISLFDLESIPTTITMKIRVEK